MTKKIKEVLEEVEEEAVGVVEYVVETPKRIIDKASSFMDRLMGE